MARYYDYNELKTRAINGDKNAVNELGEWFRNYGDMYWNGEYYDADDGFRLYPIYEKADEDEFELRGYGVKMITLKEWAIAHGMKPASARQKAGRGGFKTARKIGRDWFIDENEENPDNRVKSGKYKKSPEV